MIQATVREKTEEELGSTIVYSLFPEVCVSEQGVEIHWSDKVCEYFVDIPTDNLFEILNVQLKGLLNFAGTKQDL
jgi:hypothetical protein